LVFDAVIASTPVLFELVRFRRRFARIEPRGSRSRAFELVHNLAGGAIPLRWICSAGKSGKAEQPSTRMMRREISHVSCGARLKCPVSPRDAANLPMAVTRA
jgi:hypothetical protein